MGATNDSKRRRIDDYNALPLESLFAPIALPAQQPRPSKACSRCGVDKALDEFNRERRARDGRRADCRECQHETARAIHARPAYARKTT